MDIEELEKRYKKYCAITIDVSLPAAFIDKKLLDENIDSINNRAKGMPIRIASKSVRSVEMLKYLKSKVNNYAGLMSFTLDEMVHLSKSGFDNVLMGYPSIQNSMLKMVAEEVKLGKKLVLMSDRIEHLKAYNEVASRNNIVFDVCVDIDCSTKHLSIYFGVYRSSITNKGQLREFLFESKKYESINIVGLMGYEAQIAGVTDNIKGSSTKNNVIRLLKKKSISEIAKRRSEFNKVFKEVLGKGVELYNAGGTGSIESSIKEDWVNEITVGSGFYNSWMFDGYKAFQNKPAAFYGLEIVRSPKRGVFTAHGGGYIASGTVGNDKEPQPYLPTGMKFSKNEGAGEVQTPLHYTGTLEIGDTVFFRHAKAGELMERFNEINIIEENKIEMTFKTYRGEGRAFL